jgi:IS5 family transposase
VGATQVIAPSNGKGKGAWEKAKLRKAFRRRAGIEPIIGHVKSDCGMERNYLKGEVGDEINAILAGSAFNFRSWLRKVLEKIIFVIKNLQIVWQRWSERRLEAI